MLDDLRICWCMGEETMEGERCRGVPGVEAIILTLEG